MFIKKGTLLFIAAIAAVFFVYPYPTQAQVHLFHLSMTSSTNSKVDGPTLL